MKNLLMISCIALTVACGETSPNRAHSDAPAMQEVVSTQSLKAPSDAQLQIIDEQVSKVTGSERRYTLDLSDANDPGSKVRNLLKDAKEKGNTYQIVLISKNDERFIDFDSYYRATSGHATTHIYYNGVTQITVDLAVN